MCRICPADNMSDGMIGMADEIEGKGGLTLGCFLLLFSK